MNCIIPLLIFTHEHVTGLTLFEYDKQEWFYCLITTNIRNNAVIN